MIAGRAESTSALTCIIDNQPAHDAYLRWGYTVMGEIKHATALFVYGTLQFDAVLEALLGRIPKRATASAPGWRAAALVGRVYPGLVAAPGYASPGLRLTDLSRRERGILDAFEDDRYDLREVELTSGGRGLAYVWPDGDVCGENWDAEQFKALHLQEYAARCARIAPRLAAEAGL